MGIRRGFSRGRGIGNFSKIILGGAKTGEICFFPLETKKITFFAEIFKPRGATAPCPPSDFHVHNYSSMTDSAR